MDAPRTPLIRVRKGNTLLLNSTYLRYQLPHQNRLLIRKPYGGRIDLQTTIRLECERLLLRGKPCRLIASIPLILRREKCTSREGKSAST